MEATDNKKSGAVGYVLKRYPRYSETFIVNEILAHEAAGVDIEIFSLYPPSDTHFQDAISRVKAPVTYLPQNLKASEFWEMLTNSSRTLPDLWKDLHIANNEDARFVSQAAQLAGIVHQKGIRHLHAHFATSATTVAKMAAYFAKIPYTFTAHAKDIFHESVDGDSLNSMLKDAKGVITVSDFNVQFLQENYPSTTDKVTRVYNGLDLSQFQYHEPEQEQIQILAVGRLVEKKGFADLVEACSILSTTNKNFHCRIIGTGPLEADLREQIKRLNVSEKVELLGPLPQGKMLLKVKEAAIFAAPCVIGADGNRDGLPTVLLEAMALGTPCVSTDVTGIPEILHHNETGIMVPQNHPETLASAMDQLLADFSLRKRLAQKARALIESEFNIIDNTAKVREVFNVSRECKTFQETC